MIINHTNELKLIFTGCQPCHRSYCYRCSAPQPPMKGLSTSFGCSLTKLRGAAVGWPVSRSWTVGNTRCQPWLLQSRLSAAQAVKDAPKDGNRASAGRRSRPTSGDKLVSSPRSPRPSRPEGKQPLKQRPPSRHADQAPVQHFSPVRVAQETELESAGPALEGKVRTPQLSSIHWFKDGALGHMGYVSSANPITRGG